MKQGTILLSTLLFLGIINLSLAIKCYVCSSMDAGTEGSKDSDYGHWCVDPYNATVSPVPLTDCDTTRNETVNPATNYTHHLPNVCVKMITYGSKVTENRKSETVSELTSRFCGYTESRDRCTGSDGAQSYTRRCYCSEDACNSAQVFGVSARLTMVALVAAIFVFHRN